MQYNLINKKSKWHNSFQNKPFKNQRLAVFNLPQKVLIKHIRIMFIRLLCAFLPIIVLPCILNAQPITKIAPKREFRGVWVATVANIDWPSKPGLPIEQQKQELIELLNEHKSEGMNVIILQVRPAGDAFYAKSREPWSQWLMGKQGMSPGPGYDPLAFAIKEAHARGMELHAWFNPYRGSTSSNTVFDEMHAYSKHPDWFFNYGGKKQFDPGIPDVRAYIVQVILDVVKGYDIDGIHFDDYFYPYKIEGQSIKDVATFNKYRGLYTNIDDWRRNNVDVLIKQLDDSIHHYKKWVKFGVSPFGIWKNNYEDPEGSATSGLSNYSELYADSRKWVKEGWVDYINPQIYFTFKRRAVPFATMVDWWNFNSYNRHVYVGLGAYLVNSRAEPGWKNLNEIPAQLRYMRDKANILGGVYFSSKSLTTNARAVADSLKKNFYQLPALPPQMPWLDDIPPAAPTALTAEALKDGVHLKWQSPIKAKDGEAAYGFVVYRFDEGEAISIANPKNIININYTQELSFIDSQAQNGKHYSYVVTALDRLKNESEPGNTVTIDVPLAK